MNYLHYLVQVNLYLVLFYGFYRLLLFNETFYNLNRSFLVGSAVLSFGIPFWYSDYVQSFFITQQVNEVFYTVLSPAIFRVQANAENPFTWYDLMKISYLICTAFLTIKLIFNLLQLKKLLENTDSHRSHGVGFSFFNFVFVDKDLQKREVVLEHEYVHIKQLHSADVILFEVIGVLCWFNPVVYFYKKSIKNIHEFIADDIASRLEPSKADYAMLLFSQQFGLNPHQLTNNFLHQSTLKRRIEMLQKPRSRKIALLKYGFTAPLFALMLVIASASIAKNNGIKKAEKIAAIVAEKSVFVLPSIKSISKDTSIVEPVKLNNLEETVVVGYPANVKNNPEEIFTTADENPTFPGGITELYRFIAQNLKYPIEARQNKIQGKVFAKFVVRKDGSTSDISVLKGIGYGCDEEVVRIIGILPKWNAGKQNGIPVNVYFTMPVNFILEGNSKEEINYDPIKYNIVQIKLDSTQLQVKNTTTPISSKIPTSRTVDNEKITIRGQGKTSSYSINGPFNSDDALWVIDGVIAYTDEMKKVNPEDIESISVLKNANATALYGEKGKNGVIIVTTKKAKEETNFTIKGKQLYTIKVGKNRQIIDAKTANEYPTDRIMQMNVVKLNEIKSRTTPLNEYEQKVLKEGYDGWVDIWVREQ
jgi:TonB family protein